MGVQPLATTAAAFDIMHARPNTSKKAIFHLDLNIKLSP
jgi:hypothetical protein